MPGKTLRVEVIHVKGKCPVHRKGDVFWIEEGYKLRNRGPICLHALASIMPYYVALSRGISPVELGLAKEGETAYVQCLDPCELTGGGTVVFAIRSRGRAGD
jgi:uncharacterized repeat protein (TIGR04076 family)